MDSKDLPVTEWWDPEWEVYDVPLSPFEGDRVDVDTWWAAYEHGWILGWILHGTAAYIPFHFQHQLTTGAELCTCTVTAYDTGTMFSYRRVDNPGCRYHHTGPIPAPAPFPRYGTAPACMCLYGVRRVEGAPGPYAIVNMTARYKRHEWGVWAFKIHPRCPHHGDDVRVIAKARLLSATVDGRPAWETLDDQERRGE